MVEATAAAANDTLTSTTKPSTGDQIKDAIAEKGKETLNFLSEKMHSECENIQMFLNRSIN